MNNDIRALVIGSLGALVLGSAGSAQAAAAEAAEAAENDLGEIIVTGSRVVKDGANAPSPLTVVTTADLAEVRPGNLSEALNELPVFAGSRGLNSNTGTAGSAGSPATSNNAANVANLRQLGFLRTLVLWDGRRLAPTTPDGFVDMDTIPQMLLKRVDIVTGGVSAVYGSDGIAGVVNFITDTEFQGIKGELRAGMSEYGDAETLEGGLAFGTDLFGGRGHFMGSLESHYQGPIDSKLDRPWGEEVRTIQGLGSDAFPLIHVKNARVGNMTFGGRVNGASNLATNPLYDQRFESGGYLVPFVHGSRDGISDNFNERGGDGAFYFAQLRAELQTNKAYGAFDYDFTDSLHGFLTASYNQSESTGTGLQYFNNNLSISRDNAYLLPQYRTAMLTANQRSLSFGKVFTSIPRSELETHSNNYFFNAGLRGELSNGYTWDAYYTNAGGSFDVRQNYAIHLGKLAASLDSGVSGGKPVCRAALTNPLYADCVPMNVFGENSESQAAVDYVVERLDWGTDIGMQNAVAHLIGSPFNSWAGPVNVALTGEWRRYTYEITSQTPDTSARADCTGITGNCNSNTRVHNTSVNSVPEITESVSEAAIEVGVPLLRDVTGARSLDLNAAYRYAYYDRAGDANTWKVGLVWNPIDMLTVRATTSHDFRAPSLDEAYRALAVSFTSQFEDLLSQYQGGLPTPTDNVRFENGGNPDLVAETADTVTFGVVLRPSPYFTFSVDVFRIEMDDAVSQAQGSNTSVQLACYESGGTSPLCDLIERANGGPAEGTPTTNPVVLWRNTFVNAGRQETEGMDLEASFMAPIAGRPATLRLLATYQPELINQLPGAPPLDSAGVVGGGGLQAMAKWRASAFLNYSPTDSVGLALQYRWRDSMGLSPVIGDVEADRVKAVGFLNMNVAYRPQAFNGSTSFFLNVQNVFDTEPPHAGNYLNQQPGQLGESAFGDDVIGRYWSLGVRVQL